MNKTLKKALTGLSVAAIFTVCGATGHAAVQKTPYLIYPGNNATMEVLWQDTVTETNNVLSWGTDTTYSMGSETDAEYNASSHQHKYTITGLQPNTTYYYQVAAGATVYGAGSFITAPNATDASVRFLGMGDSRSNPTYMDALMQAMMTFYNGTDANGKSRSDYSRLCIHNGDWVSTDGESYWTNEWFTPNAKNRTVFTASTPIDGVKGNHDNNGGTSTSFPKYFPFPYPNTTPAFNPANPVAYSNLYWSYDYGPVHFTMVDEYSSFASGSQQYNWIVADLQAASANPNIKWKIVIYHEPAYGTGSDADNTAVRALEPIWAEYGVDLIYCGHNHNYARAGAYTAAQANGDQITLGLPHITSGGGGAPVYQPIWTNASSGGFPHIITAWPAVEFMSFDVEGKTLTMTAYQVNNASSSTYPQTTLSYTPIETLVLNHFSNNLSPQVTATTSDFVYNRATGTYNGSLTIKNNGPAVSGNIDVVLDGILDLAKITPVTTSISNTAQLYNYHYASTATVNSIIATNPANGYSSPASAALLTTVTLKNATGSNNGEPMIRATSGGLAQNGSVTIPLQFTVSAPANSSNPAFSKITFNPITYQE